MAAVNQQNRRWLRLGVAAERIGFSYDSLRDVVQAGQFTTRRTPGGQVLIPEDELDRYIVSITKPATMGATK
jgi:excisionase family DNA binding protein